MTGQPTDDELREMLEGRASRLSPDAEREAMAGLRAAMRGTPDGSGGFAVLPVAISGRGARLPGSIAAIGLVAVIVVAVVGGRLATPSETASNGVGGTHVPESIPTLAVSGPDVAAVPAEALPQTWTGSFLQQALSGQAIVGQVIVVDGPLTTRLCNPGGSCVVDLDGLEGVPVVFPRPPQGAPTLVGPGSQTALRVREDGGLDYLGQVDADAQRPITVDTLVHEDPTPGRGLFVGGWLVVRNLDEVARACRLESPPPRACASINDVSMLTSVDPSGGGLLDVSNAINVTVDEALRPSPRLITSGLPTAESTFLVSSSGGGWHVDGIVAATIENADVPSPAPSASSSTSTPLITLPVLGVPLTADELRTMLANRALDGRLIVIDGELWLNQRACGLRLACIVPMIRGLDGIQIDTDTEARVALLRAVPPPGPLVFMAHDGILRYLGPQPADVDHPITVSQLMDTRIPSLIDPSSLIHEKTDGLQLVSGWLVIGGADDCFTRASSTRPCIGPSPWLTDDRPSDDGKLGEVVGGSTAVSLMSDPPLERVDRVVTEGSFLVRDRSRSVAWVDTDGTCDASADVVCSAGQPPIEIVAILGPTSPLRMPLP